MTLSAEKLYINILDTLKGQELYDDWQKVSSIYGGSVYLTFTGEIHALQNAYDLLTALENTNELYTVVRHPVPLFSLQNIHGKPHDHHHIQTNFIHGLKLLTQTLERTFR